MLRPGPRHRTAPRSRSIHTGNMSTPGTPRRQGCASALCGDEINTLIGFGPMETESLVQSWLSNVSSSSEMDSSEVSAGTFHETMTPLPCDNLAPPDVEAVRHPTILQDAELGNGPWPRTVVDHKAGCWWPAVTHSCVRDAHNRYIKEHDIDPSLVLPAFKLDIEADSNVESSSYLASYASYNKLTSYSGWQMPVPASNQDAGEVHDCGSHGFHRHYGRELLSLPPDCQRLAPEVQGCQISSPYGYAVPCSPCNSCYEYGAASSFAKVPTSYIPSYTSPHHMPTSTSRQYPGDLGSSLTAECTMPEGHNFSIVVDRPFEPWPITDTGDSLQPWSTLEQGVDFCDRALVADAGYASLASLGCSTNLSNGLNATIERSSNSALLAAGNDEVNVDVACASPAPAEDASLRSGNKTARLDQQGSRRERIDSPAHSDSNIVGSRTQQHSCHKSSRGKMSLRRENPQRQKKVRSRLREYPCVLPECKKSFPRGDNLREHYFTHVQREGCKGRNKRYTLEELEDMLGDKLTARLREKLDRYHTDEKEKRERAKDSSFNYLS